MAQLETLIKDALQGLVGGRVHPDIAPVDTQRPYITWQQVGGRAVSWTDKATTPGGNAWVQINVWCSTRLEAGALRKQVEDALIEFTGFEARPISAGGARHEPDLTPPAYCHQQDFDVWYP